MSHWYSFENTEALAQSASDKLLTAAQQAIATRGSFHLVVSGGNSPVPTFKRLLSASTDWSRWHIYYADERCLPLLNEQRNSHLVQRVWLNQVPLPVAQHHLIPIDSTVKEAIQEVAVNYANLIAPVLPFDMALLGVGGDGHVASLFPEQSHPSDQLVYSIFHSPKPPPERISLSIKALSQCRQLLILFTGAAKHQAFLAWQRGEGLPVTQLCSQLELNKVTVLVDKLAETGTE